MVRRRTLVPRSAFRVLPPLPVFPRFRGISRRRRDPRKVAKLTPAEARRAMIRRFHGVKPTRGLAGQKLVEIRSQVVSSSWVREIHLVRVGGAEEVMVTFRDGARAHYPGTTEADYDRLRRAGSKGKEVWRSFYRKPYVLR